ncbi:Uncharacterized protein Adt_48052 [Abeliophyllum distichum]|uniref:Bifunctional inhibitor/plant lipid transfer protein/seed storage helical domain-containing protein n=1 Tax=Abeliophyllum distichum TaxID=126358 RepID=A0ABD1NS38_9LAMI
MEAKLLATIFVFMAVCSGFVGLGGAADSSLANKCSAEFQKVLACLTFATGKAETPNKECCVAVTNLKETGPVCLCFIIQQIHNGSNPAIKQMGIQESRLLQLPSACKMANASVAECPKLLHLPANSPDAAIFNTSITTTPTASPGKSSPTTAGDSNGFRHGPQQLTGFMAIAMAIFFYAFPAGVDNRNSSAAKRARTDGGRREDDWTCPSCGNVNFSFRTTCNMRNCTQPRPADHNSKSAAKPMQAPQGYSSAAPYLGSGAPSSMYMGVPPYGSSLFNGTSIPPYDVPFSGASAYQYNYGNRLTWRQSI